MFHEADEDNTPDVFYIHSDVDTFLRDEDVLIPLFLTVVYNIDGIVVQLKDLTAVKAYRRWWATGVLTETANFQSNLDHYPMTVDREILDIFHRTQSYSKITFLQLYANTPHVHMAINKYPVSRVIAICGVHIKTHSRMILQKTKSHMQHMDDLAKKICLLHKYQDLGGFYATRPHPTPF